MFDGYATFGGVEVINDRRIAVLSQQAGAAWIMGPTYPDLEDSLLVDSGADFADPTQAPWYDPDLADVSSRFYGVYGLGFKQVYDSVRSTPVIQNSADGGTLGAPRRATKSITVSATLLASGRDAMEYGRIWLAQVLELAGCQQDEDCGVGDVMFFNEIPTGSADVPTQTRYLKQSGVTSGPFAVNEYSSRGVYNTDVEWTWTSERPGIYGVDRDVTLTVAAALAVVQDTPINWVPYPSAEVPAASVALSTTALAHNVANNGAGDDTGGFIGWTFATPTTSGSAPGPYASISLADTGAWGMGTRSVLGKILGNGSTVASGTTLMAITSSKVDVSSIPAGRLVTLELWAAARLVAGPGSVGAITVTAQWLTAANAAVGAAQALTADPRGIGLFLRAAQTVPATATQVQFVVSSLITWQSGASDTANTEARLYAGSVNVDYLGA